MENFHSFCFLSAKEVGIELPSFQKGQNNADLDDQYVDALCQAMETMPTLKYDAIIVDEGQDFDWHWWTALESSLVSPKSIFYIFYDDNQVLYKNRGSLPDDMTEFALNHNIRNSKAIFEQVKPFYRNDSGTRMRSKGPDGREVEVHKYTSAEAMRKDVIRTIQRLIEVERFDKEDLVVLTPKRLDRSALLNCAGTASYHLVGKDAQGKNQILCSTIHSFKGLERKCVLVAELDEEILKFPEEDSANRFYVGFSRAKTHLAIFGKPQVLEKLSTSAKD